jgi:threonine/homoserine/homoserine lactone efflux protein
MSTSLLIAYLLTVIVVVLVPGPDMLFCLASGLRGGPRSGLLAAVGAASGEVVHIGASALGLAAAFAAAPLLFDAVRIVGAGYLLALGLRTIRRRDAHLAGATGISARRAYSQGLMTNLLNPKMALFSVAFLPQFVDARAGNVALQFLLLGACFIAVDVVVDGAVGALAGRLGHALRRGRALRNLNILAGSVYLGLSAKLALQA